MQISGTYMVCVNEFDTVLQTIVDACCMNVVHNNSAGCSFTSSVASDWRSILQQTLRVHQPLHGISVMEMFEQAFIVHIHMHFPEHTMCA
ncbi:MAG: hypothetical protein IPL69_20090 [Saprospiraceae bacterium]|nr:hypothetical protein [Candidatus Brachybacter algidus]